jgi:Putative addiction module component
VESLDSAEANGLEELWAAEAKRRRDEVRRGLVQTIPGDEALAQVRHSLAVAHCSREPGYWKHTM